ncbi:putative cytochrome p450 monooxygenase protein [Lasiodiplodia theobromae]|uniref:Cytochrome p450 monooxygenase protein n=1 Tax=Lasiodiplodia theobromae TaxID=45133 RepID=A0A8H7IN47_9PEZI|nr:putative cytochrome p450 monooxygenase protein [Lasiodiplodia theobromae]
MRTGPEWKAHRKILQDLMTPSFLEKVAAPAIYDSMLEATKLWTEKARLAPEKAFAASADIHNAALDAVLAFSFGSQFEHKATRLQVEMLAGMKELASNGDRVVFPEARLPTSIQSMISITESITQIKSSVLPLWKWWVISKLPHLAGAIRRKNEVIRQELVKAAKTLEQDSVGQNDSRIRSAVDHIVDRERRNAEKDGRSAEYLSPTLQDEVFGFVVAGHDTTSTSLSWGVKFLADNPETQARLRDALRSSFPDAVNDKRLPKGQEIMRASIPYLDATIEEILRCGGTVPAVDRQAIQDTVLLGHHVPKGTSILMLANGPSMFSPSFSIDETLRSQSSQASEKGHMRFREWKKDDMALFKPERWLALVTTETKDGAVGNGDLKLQNASFDAQAGPSMPFGGGIRGCFGRRLAYVEMRTFLITILWTFELLKCPDEVSGYEAYDGVVHKPTNCYVRLRNAPLS